MDTALFYRGDVAWPQVLGQCATCHTTGGAADGTRFQLRPLTHRALPEPAVHHGGADTRDEWREAPAPQAHGPARARRRVLFAADSAQANVLRRVIAELQSPVTCPGEEIRPIAEGLVLLDEVDTLLKASFQLVGRPPTMAELGQVQTNGLPGLDDVLTNQMRSGVPRACARDVRRRAAHRLASARTTPTNSGNILNSVYHPASAQPLRRRRLRLAQLAARRGHSARRGARARACSSSSCRRRRTTGR